MLVASSIAGLLVVLSLHQKASSSNPPPQSQQTFSTTQSTNPPGTSFQSLLRKRLSQILGAARSTGNNQTFCPVTPSNQFPLKSTTPQDLREPDQKSKTEWWSSNVCSILFYFGVIFLGKLGGFEGLYIQARGRGVCELVGRGKKNEVFMVQCRYGTAPKFISFLPPSFSLSLRVCTSAVSRVLE